MENLLLQERADLLNDTFRMKPTRRTPLLGNVHQWKILDQGYLLSEAMENRDLLLQIEKEHHNRYQYDMYIDIGYTTPVFRALGAGALKIDDQAEVISCGDHHYMEADEYGELLNDEARFTWEKMFMRYCNHGNLTVEQFRNAIREVMITAEYDEKLLTSYNELGVPTPSSNYVGFPMETFQNGMRGLKGASLDLRRHKEEVKEYFDRTFEAGFEMFQEMYAPRESYQYGDIFASFYGQNLLSPKQFETFYWPYLKRVVDFAVENNGTIYAFSEGALLPFRDYLKEIPRGHMAVIVEMDDIFAVRNQIPNLCLMGGMPLDKLADGTEQECVDYAQSLIDRLGDGFVLGPQKALCYRRDAKRENVLAVNRFVRNYER